ncbi:MAG: 5-deoxy-glucuronate isomerase [bacterium]|nr:5-deoxy-glucuronate isomerase [bacterium]MDD5757346.1 5-deoxy-glucuronate isomerase [bacterium]
MGKYDLRLTLQPGLNEADTGGVFKYIKGFAIVNISSAQELAFPAEDVETGLVILAGSCSVIIKGKEYADLGQRKNVFSGLPTGIYIPAQTAFILKGKQALVAVCRSACKIQTETAIFTPDKIKPNIVGKDNWSREVRMIIGSESPAVNMLVGETINFPGNWSGTPPHRHEVSNLPQESLHEELYYFSTDKPQGWGLERFYSPERGINELIFLEQNSITFMPWGYHQIAAGPGYNLHYLFFLSGEGKKLVGAEDPQHNWIKQP